MHTLSPAAMAAIRILAAETSAAAIATGRPISIHITNDIDTSTGETFACTIVDVDGARVTGLEDAMTEDGNIYGTDRESGVMVACSA